jgi:hypothetical protein
VIVVRAADGPSKRQDEYKVKTQDPAFTLPNSSAYHHHAVTMSDVVDPHASMTLAVAAGLLDLPPELHVEILSFLSPFSIARHVSPLNRHFYELALPWVYKGVVVSDGKNRRKERLNWMNPSPAMGGEELVRMGVREFCEMGGKRAGLVRCVSFLPSFLVDLFNKFLINCRHLWLFAHDDLIKEFVSEPYSEPDPEDWEIIPSPAIRLATTKPGMKEIWRRLKPVLQNLSNLQSLSVSPETKCCDAFYVRFLYYPNHTSSDVFIVNCNSNALPPQSTFCTPISSKPSRPLALQYP